MALTVSLLGSNFSIPEPGDVGYDQQLTSYLKSLATAFPQLSGGTYALTAELDLGATFGVKQAYLKTETATPATAGVVRLAKTDAIDWRNNANSADLALKIDTGDALTFNGANVTGNPFLGANTAAGQSIPASVTTIVIYGTVELDTDSGYNAGTGRYTIPTGKGGQYEVIGTISWNAALTGTSALGIFKNAVQAKLVNRVNPGASDTVQVSGVLNLVAGDVIDIRILQTSAGAVVLQSTASNNYVAIKRLV